MKFLNAKQYPSVIYGRHFAPGVAEYRPDGKDAFRILINEETAKKMDRSFMGKPIYVGHVDNVHPRNIESADGYVVESFYNKADGMHWVKMVLVTDAAHEAVRKGFRLSNAYKPKQFTNGGLWHGVEYAEEVTDAEYEHLALVDDPRYDESIILDIEGFKEYNTKKELELKQFANSKEKSSMKLNLFRRTKVENSKEVDFDGLVVALPKSKKEMPLLDIIDQFDTIQNMHGYANGDHMVKLNDTEEMSVNGMVKELTDCRNKMMEMEKSKGADGDEMENAEDDDDMDNEKEEPSADEDSEDLGEEKDEKLYPKKNSKETPPKKDDVKKNSKESKTPRSLSHFEKLKNARQEIEKGEGDTIFLNSDRVRRGKELFGSN